ncbi:MAG: hypothetical protein M3Q58_03115, partial [Bacteroidota bacterium]|nr:hypothetical protein [Bacteroidota bacterium]
AIYEDDSEKVKLLHAELVTYTNEARKTINEKPVFDGNDSFKNSILSIMDFYKSVAENDYKKIITILETEEELSDESADKIEDIFSAMYDKENEYYNELEKEVNIFAKKYEIEVNDLNALY